MNEKFWLQYGMRPLLMAAWHGHRDAAQLLINTGACTNAINKVYYTMYSNLIILLH